MPTRVLILENDLTFATELANGLRSLGAEATVVEDPNQGLQLATTERPNLIVLAVELHKMNGFSVCSRLKKEATLSSVPIVLVTSNSTDVTIEQHRQRPNHADDYVRKPIAIPELINRLRGFVTLTPSARPSVAPGDDEIVIDDEILELDSRRPSSLRPRSSVIPADSDVSTFTDNAFDGIMSDAGKSIPPRESKAPPGMARHSVDSGAGAAPGSSANASPASIPPHSESTRMRVRMLEDALEEANNRVKELESRDLPAREAELEALRRELDETRAKLMTATRGGSTSGTAAREVLDLREQLHKKEKDVLDLRDRLTQREKELLSLKDNALAFEREKADISDRFDEAAHQLAEAQRLAEANRSDKEAAVKRAEDAKRRIDKLTQQLEEKAQELDEHHDLHEAALREHANEKARWVEEHQAAEQRASEELRSAMARASAEINLQAEKAQQRLEQALAEAEQRGQDQMERVRTEVQAAADAQLQRELESLRRELTDERASALAAKEREVTARLEQSHAEATNQVKAAHAAELERSSRERDTALQQARATHAAELERVTSEKDSALQQLRSESEASLRQAQSERELAERQRDERIAALRHELDESSKQLTDARDRITVLERDLDESSRQLTVARDHVAVLERDVEESSRNLTDARNRIALLEQQIERATHKWAEDRVNIERTKDALAAALVQLESIEQRPLENG